MTEHERKIEMLAIEIMELLTQHDSCIDVAIYYNNKKANYNKNIWVVENDVDVTQWIEYNNTNTITMTFEGAFNHCLNYNTNPELLKEFDKLVESYGYYYEQGYAWSLALYQ